MERQGCCVSSGESKEFMLKVKVSCTPEGKGDCCTVAVECCPDSECCTEDSPDKG